MDKPKKNRSKFRKILVWVLGSILGLLLLIVVGLMLFFPEEKVRQYAVEKGSEALGRDLSIGSLELSFWGGLGVVLSDVKIANAEGFSEQPMLTAESIDAKLRLLPLLSNKYLINRLIISRPVILLEKKNDSLNNYTFKALEEKTPPELKDKMPKEASTAAVAISFDHLEIDKGSIVYFDEATSRRISLVGLGLSTALTIEQPGVYLSSGNIRVDTARAEGDFSFAPIRLALNYSASYDNNNKSLRLNESTLEVNSVRVSLKGNAENLLDKPKASGNIRTDRINVANLLSLISPEQLKMLENYELEGFFDLDADIVYDPERAEPFSYSGTSNITEMRLATKEVPGEFTFQRASFDFEPNNLRMNIQQAFFDGKPFKGHLAVDDFDDPVINGEIAGAIDLTLLNPFLPIEGGHKLGGEAGLDVKFSGRVSDYKNLNFSGQVTVTGGSYSSAVLPETMKDIEVNLFLNNDIIDIRTFSTKTSSGNVTIKGRAEHLLPYLLADSVKAKEIRPSFEGQFKGSVNLALVNAYLPEKGSPKLKGILEADLSFSGKKGDYSNIKPYGKITIKEASYTDSLLPEPIKHFEAALSITPDTIRVDRLTAEFESSDVEFKGRLTRPFPYLLPIEGLNRENMMRPMFNFELTSRRFDVDRLFPEAVPGSVEEGETSFSDSVSMMLLPDIDGAGTFKIDSLIYSKVTFDQVNGKVKIRDRVIECYEVDSRVYSGKVTGNSTIDLNDMNNPRYVGSFKAEQVEANDFISRFTKLGGHLFGKIDIEGNYDASGWEPEQFQNSLNMTGKSDMKDGKVVTSGSLFSSLNGLAEKSGKSFNKEQVLKNFWTNIKIKDGKVTLDEVKSVLGNIGDIAIDGSYGLITGALEYNGSLLLSEAYTNDLLSKGGLVGGLTGLLSDKSTKRVKLPLSISGSMDHPKVKLELESALKDASKNAVEEKGKSLLDQVKDKLKKK